MECKNGIEPTEIAVMERFYAAGAIFFANIWDTSLKIWNCNTEMMELESLPSGSISIRGTSYGRMCCNAEVTLVWGAS